MTLNKKQQAIFSALTYYGLFGRPLTLMEIKRNLVIDPDSSASDYSLDSILEQLKSEELKQLISCYDGYYFLSDSPADFSVRHELIKEAEKKYRRAEKGLKLLSYCPFVRLVALCNNFAFEGLKSESDIDLFIIIKDGRLFLSRLIIVSLLSAFGLRRHGKKISNRLCLSFFITDKELSLEKMKIEPKDWHFEFWISNFVPVLDDGIFLEFWKANSWIKKDKPFLEPYLSLKRRVGKDALTKGVSKGLEKIFSGWLGDYAERVSKRLQLKKMSYNRSSLSRENDTRVIISDQVLKFHEQDRRKYYNDLWRAKTNLSEKDA